MHIHVDITPSAFDPQRAHADFRAALTPGECGAITAFTGLARADDGVSALGLSHYEGATQAAITQQLRLAGERWDLLGACVVHRTGEVMVSEPIVFVAAASIHRREAFLSADYIMDYLKSEAMFWKYERRGNQKIWIEPRARDLSDARRWETP